MNREIYKEYTLPYRFTNDEINSLIKAWTFFMEFRRIDLSLHQYRKELIKIISSKYTPEEFLFYEGIIDKLYWNLQSRLARIWLQDPYLNEIPYSLTLSQAEPFLNTTQYNYIINENLKRDFYRSFINKLIVIDKTTNIIYTKDQEGSSNVMGKNYFNLLGSAIMSSIQLYERILHEPHLIIMTNIPLPMYYHQLDYGFPNFSLCAYNINDINTNEGRMYRLNRIKKLYYEPNCENNWFKLIN
jgi:hypothetical protein